MKIVTRAALLPAFLLAACSHRAPGSAAPADGSRIVLTAEDIEHSPGQSLEQLLLARVPGLYYTRDAGGKPVLYLRGSATFKGDVEPLFVVNDIPLTSNPLSAINPHDVETVEVVRDAARTALYGSRGANGVIIIRTKTS